MHDEVSHSRAQLRLLMRGEQLSLYMHFLEWSSLWGLRLFLLLVASVSIRHTVALFFQRHGVSHRIAGGTLMSWLVLGACSVSTVKDQSIWFFYDIVLGVLGIAATITAARDFPHVFVKNEAGQSGTLERKAIVTQSEMIEHSFYQGLNLVQAVYLHFMANYQRREWHMRLLALWLVTSPWYVRHLFPVHSFSNNWKHKPSQEWNLEIVLYRIKKWQYVFYKHAVFHGLNISIALNDEQSSTLVSALSWRIFWLALNTSYVMEFFLQSLVKRGMMDQHPMLWLQRLLMTASSLAALVAVVPHLNWGVCILSILLNYNHRGHDVLNTMLIAVIATSVLTLSSR